MYIIVYTIYKFSFTFISFIIILLFYFISHYFVSFYFVITILHTYLDMTYLQRYTLPYQNLTTCLSIWIPPIPQIILPLYHRNRVRTTCANNTIPLHLPTACVNISLSLFFLTVIFLLLLFCTYDLRVRVERCSSHLPYRPTGPG